MASGNGAAEIAITATNTGTFTVIVDDTTGTTATGTYRLTLATMPGTITVAPGDEGGTLTNGYTHAGTLSVGDLDVWSFTVNSGDGIVVRLGEAVSGSSLYPLVRIYGPNGALLDSAVGSFAAEVVTRATNSGVFTVVAANYESGSFGGNGTYRLTLATTSGGIVVPPGDEGGTMTNGFTHQGDLPVGDSDVWVFTANSGDSIVVRLGEAVSGSSLYPSLQLYGPNGALLDSAVGSFAAEVITRATNSGTFIVVAGNYENGSFGGNGAYRLTLAATATNTPIVVASGDEGGTLTNGYTHAGTLPVGDMDVWSFTANAGDGIVVRLGEAVSGSSLYPLVRIYGPNGALMDSAVGSFAAEVIARATNSGTFTVVAANYESGSFGGNGNYRLTLATSAGGIVVPPGDEGGTMTNGFTHQGDLPVGDSDVWVFTANSGDGIVVRLGEAVGGSSLYSYLQLYGPNGALLDVTVGSFAAEVITRATNSGTFTLIAANYESGSFGGNGTYRLTLSTTTTNTPIVVASGDEGGSLTNGYTHTGSLPVGDMDVWSFTANAGDSLVARMGEVTAGSSLYPLLRIYGPNGVLLDSTVGSSAAEVATRATNSGIFIVVADNYEAASFGGSGSYRITVATTTTNTPIIVATGDEGGTLTNGVTYLADLPIGDLDVWSFTANSGDNIVVAMGEIVDGSSLYPYLQIYGPNGALLDSTVGSAASEVFTRATNSGTFTVVVDNYEAASFGGNGAYRLTLAKTSGAIVVAPGDEGGTIPNGAMNIGTNDIGDLDVWSFTASAGDKIAVGFGEAVANSTLYPHLRLYGQNGVLLASSIDSVEARISTQATNSGTFTVVMANYEAASFGGNGAYRLTLAQVPRAFVVSPGDEGGALTNGLARDAFIQVGDSDMWSFTANGGDSVQLVVTNTSGDFNFRPAISVYTPNGTLLNSAFSGTQSTVSNLAPVLGTYTVVMQSQFLGGAGSYRIRLDKFPPEINPPLLLGVATTNRFFTSGDRRFYKVTVPPGGHLRLTFDDLDNLGSNEIYVRRGSAPTAGLFDYKFTKTGADQSLLVPDADAGDWYVMVVGANVTGTGGYTLRADFSTDIILESITPNRLGNLVPVTIAASGAAFDSSVQAFLKLGATTVRTGIVNFVSSKRLLLDFDITGISSNTYQLTLTRTTNTAALPIQILEGGIAKLETELIAPAQVRRGAPATIFVEYANTGDAPMDAPLLVLHGSGGARLTLDMNAIAVGLWSAPPQIGFSDTVQILGSGATPGILQPGERIRVPVAYVGFTEPVASIQFDLGVFDNSNTNTVDWNSLKASLRPSSITSNAWDVIWANFIASVGPTWGDYDNMLAENALYLGKLGLNVTDVSELLAFELAQADSLNPVGALASGTDAAARQPGFNLVFGRVFPQSISQRLRFGPLGWGWSHNWSFNLTEATNGSITINGPAGAQRTFQSDLRGGYFTQAGDFGKIIVLGLNTYEVRETDGSRMVFRADGKLDFVEDLNANRITAAYSGALLTSLTHSSGQSLTLNYSGGLLQSVTDPFGRVTTYAYDGAQNLASATYYGTNTVSYAYVTGQGAAREHALATVTYPGGTHEYFGYDPRGRLITVNRDGGAEAVNFAYDTAGTVFVTDTFTNQSKLFFDQRGLLAKVENPLKNNARFSFDKNFNLTSLQGPDGKSSALTLDAKGNVTKVLDPAGNALAMSYTNNTRLGKLTDARGQTTAFNYDTKGNVTGMVYPNGSLESYTNDARGEVIAVQNRRGQVITLTRDSFGRVTHKATPEGRTFDYDYDARGNLTNVIDSLLGTNRMTYDNRDLLASLTYHDGKGFTFQYDAAGRRAQRTSHDGYTLKYFYDSLGRLWRLEDGTSRQIIEYLYDTAGRLSRENKGNNTWTTYDYDAAGQVLHLVNYGTNGVPLSRFDYTYDANGNRTSMTTLAGTNSYTYDSIGQLTGVTYPNGRHVTYTYDAASNRTAVNDNGTNTLYTVNNLNQYTQVGSTTYGFDADGNQTNKTETAGATSYEFDSENRLMRVVTSTNGTWQYTYDAFGNRASVSHDGQNVRYLLDLGSMVDVAAEYTDSGFLIVNYNHGIGLASRVDNSNTAAFYQYDAVGHTRELTDIYGNILNSYDYEPFGEKLQGFETITNSFRYVGRFGVIKDENGLQFVRARYYDNLTGRFNSPDPIWPVASIKNAYSYANNSPAIFADVSGLATVNTMSVSFYGPISVSTGVDPATGEEYLGLEIGFSTSKFSMVTLSAEGDVSLLLPWLSAGSDKLEPGFFFARGFALGVGGMIVTKNLEEDTYYATVGRGATLSFAYVFKRPDFLRKEKEVYIYTEIGSKNTSVGLTPPVVNYDAFSSTTIQSFDPNELIGPAGYGPQNYLKGDGTFAYRIGFENASNATAPAQVVVVTNTIATNLNLATLEFTSVGFGDYFFAIPPGSQHYEHTESIEFNGTTFDANIEVSVDTATRQVRARFDSVMPESGLPPAAEIGFLPPENGTYRGMGHVSYVIRPVSGLPTGTAIRNIGTITFDPLAGGPTFRTDLVNPTDPNSGIDTNRQALVTIDTNLPISAATGPSGTATNTSFVVTWSGSDVGAGVTSYDIFVQTNSGAWKQWLSFTTNTSAIFGGYASQTYGFYSVARDGAGNLETNATIADVTVTMPTNSTPQLDPIADKIVDANSALVFTNFVNDHVAPGDKLKFSLLTAPVGARIRNLSPTNGLFFWRPACDQGGTTNIITIQVTDNDTPPMTATQTFVVSVPDCVQVSLGHTVVRAGDSVGVPVELLSTVALSNVVVNGNYVTERFTNVGLVYYTQQVATVPVFNLPGAGVIAMEFGLQTNHTLRTSTGIGALSLTAISNQSSAFVWTTLPSVNARRLDGSTVTNAYGVPGRVVVVSEEPLMESLLIASNEVSLLQYALTGSTMRVQSTTNVFGTNWQLHTQTTQTNLVQETDKFAPIPPAKFFRAIRGTNGL